MTFCDLCGAGLSDEEEAMNAERDFDIDLCEDCMQEGERMLMDTVQRLLSRRKDADSDGKRYSWEDGD